MPLIIKAACSDCQEVELGVEDVTLHLYDPIDAAPAYYVFTCPDCDRYNQKYANEYIQEVLIVAEVAIVVHDIPAEALEAHVGPTINHDDIMDLHLALATDAWMEELLGDPDV